MSDFPMAVSYKSGGRWYIYRDARYDTDLIEANHSAYRVEGVTKVKTMPTPR